MKLIQELTSTVVAEAKKEPGATERARSRVQTALEKSLEKEFAGNDALVADLMAGMMDFYDYHMRLPSMKDAAADVQRAEVELRQLLPRTARIETSGNSINVQLGTLLDAALNWKNGKWDLVVAGFKTDIPVDTFDSIEEVALVIKDIARQGKKWYVENDPHGDRW